MAELRPGTYDLSFTLGGFATVRRDGVEVSGGGAVISINIDMRVGGLQETVTVSGDTPVVDVQSSTRKQMVLDDAVVEALPASRGYGNLLSAVPGHSEQQPRQRLESHDGVLHRAWRAWQ